MSAKPLVFVDTNVWVYAYDFRDQKKRKTAQTLITDLAGNGELVISLQVIQEFCNVAMNKIGHINQIELLRTIDSVLAPLIQHVPDVDFIKRAVKLQDKNSLSFYDALIVQAALDMGCATIYSEDLQDGQKFGSLMIKDPFRSR